MRSKTFKFQLFIIFFSLSTNGDTHSFYLEKGWNLLTMQVEPNNPSPDFVFRDSQSDVTIEKAWRFDNNSKKWLVWENQSNPGTGPSINEIASNPMRDVNFGDAIWIHVANSGNISLSGIIPLETPEIIVTEGWNLIGIPVSGSGYTSVPENTIPILSVLAIPELTFDQLVRWQSGAPSPDNRKSGFNINELGAINGSDFLFFDPLKPIWIYSTTKERVAIKPKLIYHAQGDINNATDRFPGPEDLWVSGKSKPVGSTKIRRIVFFHGEEQKDIGLQNTGGGILSWEAQWIGEGNLGNSVGLSHSRLTPDNTKVFPRLSGLVANGDRSKFYLNLDRAALSPNKSPYNGILRVKTSASIDPIDFETLIYVPPLMGDWSGNMTVTTVNGLRNSVPNPDLHLSFYEDAKSAGVLRGIINSSVSTFWPVDVPIFGYLTGQNSNSIVLSGSYYLPPGDRNVPPFSVFDPRTTKDIDWNGNGRMDNVNPFPFPILRTVSLTGNLVAASSINGYRIEGKFIDVIHGMLRDAIRVEGSFELDRTHLEPFSHRDIITNSPSGSSGFQPVQHSELIEATSVSDSRTINLPPFKNELNAAVIRLKGQIRTEDGKPIDPTAIKITLKSPDKASVVLHDKSEIDAQSLGTFDYKLKAGSFGIKPNFKDDFISKVNQVKGAWQLIVENTSNTAIEIFNVRLTVVGQSLVDVSGRVVDADGTPVAGAIVSTSGMPFSFVLNGQENINSRTDSEGYFKFYGLPAMPYNFTANLAGFNYSARLKDSSLIPRFDLDQGSEGSIVASHFRPLPLAPPPELGLSGFATAGELNLYFEQSIDLQYVSVGPKYGQAPLIVHLDAGDRTNPNWNVSKLDFSGNTLQATSISALANDEYVFQSPGVYKVQYKSGDQFIITVMQSQGHVSKPSQIAPRIPGGVIDSYEQGFVFWSRFAGGGSYPIEINPEVLPSSSASLFAGLFMLQHTYAGSMDIDLAPYTSYGESFRSDSMRNFPEIPDPSFWTVNRLNRDVTDLQGDPGWEDEDHNYYLPTEAWFFEPKIINFIYDSDVDKSLSVALSLDKKENIYHDFRNDEAEINETSAIVNSKALIYQDTTDPNNPKIRNVDSYRMSCQIAGQIIAVGSLSGAVVEAPGPNISVRNLQQQKTLFKGGGTGSSNRILSLKLNPFCL